MSDISEESSVADGPGGREAGVGVKLPSDSAVSDVKSMPGENNGGSIAVHVCGKHDVSTPSVLKTSLEWRKKRDEAKKLAKFTTIVCACVWLSWSSAPVTIISEGTFQKIYTTG